MNIKGSYLFFLCVEHQVHLQVLLTAHPVYLDDSLH